MIYTFSASLLATPRTKKIFSKNPELAGEITAYIQNSKPIANTASYNNFIHGIVRQIKEYTLPPLSTPIYKKEIAAISKNLPLTEKVAWGGVSMKKVDVAKDFTQKLLVISSQGILGFEIHEKKLEKLRVIEGICLVIYSNHTSKGFRKGYVSIQLATSGDRFTFQPFDEHGVIALSDCVIEETSTNHLDDLVYVFPSKQIVK